MCIFQPTNNQLATKLVIAVVKLRFLHEIYFNHIVILIMVIAVAFATKARKNIDYNITKHFITPFFIGLFLFVTSLLYPFDFLPALNGLPSTIVYASFYLIGTVLLHTSLSNLSKILGTKVKDDIWNVEQQSFEQNRHLVKADYLINIPMQFYYKKKWHDGWININVFRALMVLGVPGSGKTESIIIPYIKQLLSMGYTMLVYDFKYPDLAEITYYHYLKNKQHNGPLKDHQFHVINVDQLEQSRRVNPILPKYIETLSDASETAEAMVLALKKGAASSGGSDQFFTLSAINLLGASIYYFAKYENGKYCTIPHVLAFLNLPYARLFETLFKMQEIQSLLSPFRTAYENKAFEQLEGQVGTLKVQLSRLVTKETFWIFSGNDIDLKISNPPAILILANSDRTQNTNSAFYSSLLMRTLKQINSKNNYPSAIIIDETP
ncbi:MAG: type IV secretory system conjugative DNA transfer family protein, partial [Granulicella sp.]